MDKFAPLITLAAALVATTSAHAAESGMLIRAGELKAQPFIDAATAEQLPANQPVSIIARQGGWVQVISNGKTGWVRMLNLRLEAAVPGSASSASAALLRTGSSGRTVTTGVKGMDEADIRNASIDLAELEQLNTLAIDPVTASAHAAKSGLKESQVSYLPAGRGK